MMLPAYWLQPPQMEIDYPGGRNGAHSATPAWSFQDNNHGLRDGQFMVM